MIISSPLLELKTLGCMSKTGITISRVIVSHVVFSFIRSLMP